MDFFLAWSIMFALGAAVIYQLVSGRALDRGWKPTILRKESPRKYWAIVGFQIAFILFGVATDGKGSFTWDEIFGWFRDRELNQADALRREGKLADSIASFDRLAADDPGDPRIYYGRALANRNIGNADAALADFRRVIAIDPAHYPSYVQADRILSRQKRWDEVLAMWGAYLARHADKAEAWYERGGTHFRMGNLEAARDDAARACSLGLAEACKRVEGLIAKPPPAR